MLLHKVQNPGDNLFVRCADLILPWLTPQEMAVVSLTCKPLNLISKSITLRRSLDAARSLENLSFPFCNTVDRLPYVYFIYTPCQVLAASSSPRQLWGTAIEPVPESLSRLGSFPPAFGVHDTGSSWLGESLSGCWCERCEDDDVSCCPCKLGLEGLGIVTECGSGCECGSDCPNRLTQRGISVRLKIVRDHKKGWALYADQLIKKGKFICEYAGELLTTEEARRRQQIYDKLSSDGDSQFSSALLVVREHLPSGKACLRINIDATRIGNIARFINHSCDGGNLCTVLVRSSGTLLPRLCFFASKDIERDEELTFSYGDIRVRVNGVPCFCGSSCCLGTLPSEET